MEFIVQLHNTENQHENNRLLSCFDLEVADIEWAETLEQTTIWLY